MTGNHDLTSLRAEKEDAKLEPTFEAGIIPAFIAVRQDLEQIARETNTYADKILGVLGQLEELRHREHAGFRVLTERSNMNQEKFDNLFSTYSSLLDELGPWRIQVVQAGEEAIQTQSVRMRKSRRDMMNAAKDRLDQGREKQQLATNASELMKHYKALIMAV